MDVWIAEFVRNVINLQAPFMEWEMTAVVSFVYLEVLITLAIFLSMDMKIQWTRKGPRLMSGTSKTVGGIQQKKGSFHSTGNYKRFPGAKNIFIRRTPCQYK